MDCGDCVFNITDDGPPMSGGPYGGRQIGCRAGRIEKLINKGKAAMPIPETSYELTQFCNMYRDSDIDLETARDQVMPLFGVVVNMGKTKKIEDLSATVDSLLEMDYPQQKVKIVISTVSTQSVEAVMHQVHRLQEKYLASEAVFHLHDITPHREGECFKKLLQAAYFVRMISGSTLDSGVFKFIDKDINDDLNMTCMYESDRVTIVNKKIIRDLYLNFNDYEKTVDHIRSLCLDKGLHKRV
tara:strand:+ start:427 stop:1152 length:726 start_codon:yes stop_codon:yes gene_type:complete